jgi:protein involved in ribonucleotide reduction
MLIAYHSLTGNVKRFLDRCEFTYVNINDNQTVNELYVLVTNTIGFGQIPESVANFLNRNSRHLVGVAASGNRNWGANFAKAADLISEKYNVPIVHKFELSGSNDDIKIFTERVYAIDKAYRN